MLLNALHQAKLYMKEIILTGDHVIDATAGNGHDTLFLATLVGDQGRVTAFDIQQAAINATRLRLEREQLINQVTLHLASHATIKDVVSGPIRGAMFNLGYLPGADHTITTTSDVTWEAIEGTLDLLIPGGRTVIVLYHGHENGKQERVRILQHVATLPQERFKVLHSAFLNQQNSPPELVVIEKKKQPVR